MMRVRRRFTAGCLLAGLAAGSLAQAATGGLRVRPLDFDRDIRPILSENCFTCHGPDEERRKAGLRLDLKQGAFKKLKNGEYAIVPGDLKRSQLVRHVTSQDPDEHMPPPKSGKKLTAAQIDLLCRWIQQGARWEPHWAYVAPVRPALPAVKDKPWPRNEIDRFVLAKLEAKGIHPSPPAPKPALIRRVTLDLTGLPPTPAQVDAFLADKSPGAYDKLVDRLLSSPGYGENMARDWLDAVRYADSHGYHIDSERSIWKYRDWVINAFNRNLPFDQFTVKQLAGDLLPKPTLNDEIASGYIRCNMSTGEGGAIEAEYHAKYTFDRVETTSTVWLGLTMTCARCHSHKYDPILQREYYSFYAIFNNLDETTMDGNIPNPRPFIKVPSREQTERLAWLKSHLAAAQAKINGPAPDLDSAQQTWERSWRDRLVNAWSTPEPLGVKPLGTHSPAFQILPDQSLLATTRSGTNGGCVVTLKPAPGRLAALRLVTFPSGSSTAGSVSDVGQGPIALAEFDAELIPPTRTGARGKDTKTEPEKLKFTRAVADAWQKGETIGQAIDGKADTAWRLDSAAATAKHEAVFVLASPVAVPAGSTLRLQLHFGTSKANGAIDHFRLDACGDGLLPTLLHPPDFSPWQVVGPFKSPDAQAGFATVYPPEQAVDLKRSYPGVRGPVKWEKEAGFTDGRANLLVEDLHGVHGVRYLYRTLTLPAPRRIQVGLRADGLFKLWVNGRLALERNDTRQSAGEVLKTTVDLNGGENRFLAKIVTVQGAAYFTFTKDLSGPDTLTPQVAAILALDEPTSPRLQGPVRDYYRRTHSPQFRKLFATVDQWREEQVTVEHAIPTTLVAKELPKPQKTFLLIRGQYDRPGERVWPGVPAILPPLPKGMPKNRLALAKWLVEPQNPLTARVTVNRFWQHYFGIGLVKTPGDFGVQGDPPSDQPLLDWLATEFIHSGWDIKHIQRLIVTSATYQQSSRGTPQLLARDPENRLLARGPRFRMDAEMIRDSALAISGLLVERLGGHSVKPYQPPGLWKAVSYGNAQTYVPDTGAGDYRRSLYTYWKRQCPPPNMLLFDAPTREYCTVYRSRSNTPLQALDLLNDPQYVEAARALAQRILLRGGQSARTRMVYAFRLATARRPAPDELRILLGIVDRQLAHFRQHPDAARRYLSVGSFRADPGLDKSELAAWSTLASMILNLDETITKG
jgi:Protein of unknown function (DUF1553)/Protein of unknown function (DUF1549)/Planctomycete cytochrome C